MKINKGFTLIELLVVIAIIGILSSIVISSLNEARKKSRDVQRREHLRQMFTAVEMRYSDTNNYPVSDGWMIPSVPGSLDNDLVGYIKEIQYDPKNVQPHMYMYWRKDFTNGAYPCLTNISANKIAFYARLENPTTADLATISSGDSFDACVVSIWGMNYKVGHSL